MLHNYIADGFCQGDKERVLIDSVASHSSNRPPSISGYIPDAYVMLSRLGRVVIGEAKTMRDLENAHTQAQIVAFLKRCRLVEDSAFVLAVPWPVERLAKAVLLNIRSREGLSDVAITVISEAHHLQSYRHT